ncbi:MAG: disulfide bond formation protein B [Acidimicrobiia bacterium]|nr:disulfide bond formation protein B [Acidimicrobiia bacterium]
MTVESVSLFFALLSLLVVAGIVALMIDALTTADLRVVRSLRPVSLEIGAAIATTSMLGSLYLSEIANFDPCRLCWIQRFFMYPAAFVLIAAVFTRNVALQWVAFALSTVGLGVAVYHRYEQFVYDPLAGHEGGFCDPLNPCGLPWVETFGFITIPTMAAAGFAGVMAMVLLNTRKAAQWQPKPNQRTVKDSVQM